MPRSREEILEQFRACAQQLGRTPGEAIFSNLTGIKPWDVKYYWPTFSAFAKEAGLLANEYIKGTPEDELLEAYARVCLHLKKIPTTNEFRIAARELGSFREGPYSRRYGSTLAWRKRFREWIQESRPDFAEILNYEGWSLVERAFTAKSTNKVTSELQADYRPFLPYALQNLDRLSRGEGSSLRSDENVNTAFERRCADAFRCLGFEVESLGQGRGRKADCLALARQESFGVIIDAKVRQNGYVLGTEDRKFLEYAVTHAHELQRNGIPKVYFVIVGSEFRESDLTKLTNTWRSRRSAVWISLLLRL